MRRGAFGGFGWLTRDATPAERLNMAFKIRKCREGIEVGMHKGEIFNIRQASSIRPNADLQLRKLFPECVAPRLGVADMFVEINDEQRYD